MGKSGVSDERRVASEADFLLIAAQSDIARGDAREARRKLDALIAQFPAEPAAVDAQRLLQRLPGVAPASTAVDRTPAEGSGSGSERGQLPPAGADRAAAIDGRRLKVLVDDFRATIGDRVFFGEASADIGAKSRAVLAAQAEWLKRHNALVVTIEGHADDRGPADLNREIAERRADAVRSRLIEEGVRPERVRVRALGREQQVAPCSNPGCAAQNRRVVTVIFDRNATLNQARGQEPSPTGYTRARGN